jgi:Fe-S oxidoreductase
MSTPVTISVEGRTVVSGSSRSIIEAIWDAGFTLVTNVGCLGQGVCGSCRVMVRRPGGADVSMELACETTVEAGMEVAFVAHLESARPRPYAFDRPKDSWDLADGVEQLFPEASQCRHCGGCDSACPRGIPVQLAVETAVEGRVGSTGDLFDACVMCDLCSDVCPESIDPNHLGLWSRRVTASSFARPVCGCGRRRERRTEGRRRRTARRVSP